MNIIELADEKIVITKLSADQIMGSLKHHNPAWRLKHGFESVYTKPDWKAPELREVAVRELPVGCRSWVGRTK